MRKRKESSIWSEVRKGKLVVPEMGKNKREFVRIKFSKSGVPQEWNLYFHSGRLLTNEVYANWNPVVYLRTVEKCRTLNDVIEFLKVYSYAEHFIVIGEVLNMDERGMKRSALLQLLQLKINVKALQGCVYWGRHTITFDDGSVNFRMGHINDGTFTITGIRDLLRITEKLIGRLASDYEYLKAVKKLELS